MKSVQRIIYHNPFHLVLAAILDAILDSQLAPTMATVSLQIYKLQGMTNILVYNIQCSTLVTTYSMK